MDKFDLDFLIDSQDTNLLYKHILEAICINSDRIRKDLRSMYIIDLLSIHIWSTYITYSTEYPHRIYTGRIDKYVMEL